MGLAGTNRIRLIVSDWFIIVSNLSHQKGIKGEAAFIYTALPGGQISFPVVPGYCTLLILWMFKTRPNFLLLPMAWLMGPPLCYRAAKRWWLLLQNCFIDVDSCNFCRWVKTTKLDSIIAKYSWYSLPAYTFVSYPLRISQKLSAPNSQVFPSGPKNSHL